MPVMPIIFRDQPPDVDTIKANYELHYPELLLLMSAGMEQWTAYLL